MVQTLRGDAPPSQLVDGTLLSGQPYTIARHAARVEVTVNGTQLLRSVQDDSWAAQALVQAFATFAELATAAANADPVDDDPDAPSRERAWRLLYPALTELGAPAGVDFKGRVLTIQLDGGSKLVKAWARTLDLVDEQRRDAANPFGWLVTVTGQWQGWSVILNGWDPVTDLLYPEIPSSVDVGRSDA